MKITHLATFLGALALALTPPAAQAVAKASVTVTNQSNWQIDHFYLSPASNQAWGEDQLGEAVISSGEKFTLEEIPCNSWDIKVVDEDGDVCVIEHVDLCQATAEWMITSEDLVACQSKTKKK